MDLAFVILCVVGGPVLVIYLFMLLVRFIRAQERIAGALEHIARNQRREEK